MLRTSFWLWCIHGIWVVDCAHQTPRSCHGHLNICSAMAQRFVYHSIEEIGGDGNHWMWNWYSRVCGPSPPSYSTITSHGSRCHCGSQQLPCFWTLQEVPGWQVVCCRCHHEASCHLLTAGAWWQFLLCWNTGLGGMVGQMFTCYLWIGEGVVWLACYPWVMFPLKSE